MIITLFLTYDITAHNRFSMILHRKTIDTDRSQTYITQRNKRTYIDNITGKEGTNSKNFTSSIQYISIYK